MKVSAVVKNSFHHHGIVVQTNGDVKQISISPKTSGYGSSVNGAELLLLSLATCYCNDIYREAAKKDIQVSEVEVVFSCEFGSEGEGGRHFEYTANVVSTATEEEIADLLRHTDQVAEIHQTLRQGVPIKLVTR